MNQKLSNQEKVMAYILNKEMGYSQKSIAEFMSNKQPEGVTQPTIANAIKEAGFLLQIRKLQKEYSIVKEKLASLGIVKNPDLQEISDNNFKHNNTCKLFEKS